MCCFKSPTLLLQLSPKFFDPLDLDVQFQKSSPLSPNENQSIKSKLNPRMTIYVIRSLLQVRFRFQYQLTTLVWLSIDFFFIQLKPISSSEQFYKIKTLFFAFLLQRKEALGSRSSSSLTIYFFVALYSCMCSCPNISRNVFQYSFCNQLVLFA